MAEGDPPGLDSFMYAMRSHESGVAGGNYSLKGRPGVTASGAYQYTDGTWNNYKGYKHASDAPREVQDERARKDFIAAYKATGSWEGVMTTHFTGHNVKPGSAEWYQRPGHSSNPTVAQYVAAIKKWEAKAPSSTAREAVAAAGNAIRSETADWDIGNARQIAEMVANKMLGGMAGDAAARKAFLAQYGVKADSLRVQKRALANVLEKQIKTEKAVRLPQSVAREVREARSRGEAWLEPHTAGTTGHGGSPARTSPRTDHDPPQAVLGQVDMSDFLPQMSNQDYSRMVNDRGEAALAYANKQAERATQNWIQRCLSFVRQSLHVEGGVESPNFALRNGIVKQLHTDGSVPPPGVPIWWTGGAFGHVALSAGNGYAYTNDLAGSGVISLEPIEKIRDWLEPRYQYQGWSEDINGVDVWDAPSMQRIDPAIPAWAQPVDREQQAAASNATGMSERTAEMDPNTLADNADQGAPQRAALTGDPAAAERASVGARAGLNDSGSGFNARAAENATGTGEPPKKVHGRESEMAAPGTRPVVNARELEQRAAKPTFKPPKTGNVNLGAFGKRSTSTGTAAAKAKPKVAPKPTFKPPSKGNVNLGAYGKRSTTTGTAKPKAAPKKATTKASAPKSGYAVTKKITTAPKKAAPTAAKKAANQKATAAKYSYGPKR